MSLDGTQQGQVDDKDDNVNDDDDDDDKKTSTEVDVELRCNFGSHRVDCVLCV